MNQHQVLWYPVISAPFAENSYVVWTAERNGCIIVDPGFEPDAILSVIEDRRLSPMAILNTHGHSDHIAGNAVMKKAFPSIPLMIGTKDADKLLDPMKNLSAPFGVELRSPAADRVLNHGEILDFDGWEWDVIEAPGHSVGHVVFLCRQADPWILLGGDVLFRGSIGRTDFPDGNHQQLVDVIRQTLFNLPADTLVLPGHGDPTTIGEERRSNPFVGEYADRWNME